MPLYKAPGVYVNETSALPATVVPAATAIPAFVGYTEKALYDAKILRDVPRRITSFAEFEACFGGSPACRFDIEEADPVEADFVAGATSYRLRQTAGWYLLYRCLRLFFANGGGACYIVSVGDYSEPIDVGRLSAGIAALEREREVTLLVVPETTLLDAAGSSAVHQAMLRHCGETMGNRFALLDVRDGHLPRKDPSGDCIDAFRTGVGSEHLGYGAAYYPWLHTTVVAPEEVSHAHFTPADVLQALLRTQPGVPDEFDDKTLLAISPLYRQIHAAALRKRNVLPPAAAMAGLFTMVDNTSGVWKAPANVSVAAVTSPAVAISHQEQEDLNVDAVSGKSVNAIRAFIGLGVLVWGARTLDGNNNEWRYISVRRTVIMLEESIRLALRAFVFEPNDANTWAAIRAMIANFLTDLWRQGGLAGAKPDDAFGVRVGLGETMTEQDIQENRLRVSVLVSVIRPAEFIVIEFDQAMSVP